MSDAPYHWQARTFEAYRPQNRLNRSLVLVAPWLDAALLLAFFLLVTSRFVLQPGMRVRLPEAPFNAGASPHGLMAVLVVQEGTGSQDEEEILYFDDARFPMADPATPARLKAVLVKAAHDKPAQPLVIEADQQVRHGTLLTLINQAASSGIAEVYMATRPPGSGREAP